MTDQHSILGQLGTIVSWRVPSAVGFDLLRAALEASGFTPELAADMAPRNALSRALREMKQGRVIRKLRRENQLILFQFTREWIEAQEIHYEREAELSLDVDTGVVRCPEDIEIEEKARTLLEQHMAKRLKSDLTRLMHRIFEAHKADLIPIREEGGAYFVPDQHSDLVAKARDLLDAIGGRLRTYAVKLGVDETAESVAESLADHLSDMIKQFCESCENVTGDSRSDVIERRTETVAELRRKLELYRGLLSGYADTIADQVKVADEELLRKLAISTKEEPQREAA